ncbi:MAG: hypothetical protein JWO02_1506 [Solirubrobacterales bacterium]|nr:hypothetical protein [Solirubrobacterales bacterium]
MTVALTQAPTRLGLLLGFVAGSSGLGLAAAPIVLPELADVVGRDVGQTAWVLSAFSLTLAVMTPVFGRLFDRRGAGGTLAAGAALGLTGATVVLVAPTFTTIVIGRLLQGAAAAALSIVAFGIAGHHHEGASRARALGVLTAVSSLFLGAGPLIGAGIAAVLGWRATLAAPVIATLAVVPLGRLAPPGAGGAPVSLDITGAVLVLATGSAVTGLLQARATGLGAVMTALVAVVAAGAFTALIRHARSHPDGFLPRAAMANRVFMALSGSAAAVMSGFLGMSFLGPLLLPEEGGRTAVDVGLVLLPAALAAAAVAQLVGWLRPRIAVETILVSLAVGTTAGMVAAGLGHRATVLVVLGVAAATSGFAGAQVAVLDRVSELVAPEDRGVALGTFNLIFVTGGALGAALAGGLVDVGSAAAATLGIAALPLLAVPLAAVARTEVDP